MASVPDVLVEFVKACLERGMPRADIARAIESGGWSPRDAKVALDAFADVPSPVPVPKKRVSSSPRDAFLHLLAMAMLYTAAFATGTILFEFIDAWLPAATDTSRGFSTGALRAAAAALLVSLPILGFTRRTIGRDTSLDPSLRLSPIYRTLAYLTLLVTSLIMAGDLIAAIVCFLSGDLTARFILKASTILLIAGGIYLWFSSDVRREEEAAGAASIPPPPWRDSLYRLGAAVAIAYTATGGLRADVATDFFQGIFIIIGMVILCTLVVYDSGGWLEGLARVGSERLCFSNGGGFWQQMETWAVPVLSLIHI